MSYLDNNATTSIDPRVLQEMERVYREGPLNPSSIHTFGRKAKAFLMEAQESVAAHFQVHRDAVFFTSGATEAFNLALANLPPDCHVITSLLEHVAVLEPIRRLERQGWQVTYLKGEITPSKVEEAITEKTALIALMSANNETGIQTEIAPIAQLAEERSILLLVDGVAELGKVPSHPLEGSAYVVSSHKVHGPLGVGCLIAPKWKMRPHIVGGSQQRGVRAGTENVPAIYGFAKALHYLQEELEASIREMRRLRDLFETLLLDALPITVHGLFEKRVCNTSNIAFEVDGESLLIALDLAGVAASFGSACSSGSLELSPVLLNMGIPPEKVRSSLRFSLSKFTTEDEIVRGASQIIKSVHQLQS